MGKTIDNVKKLLEWGFFEDLLQSSLTFSNDYKMRLCALGAISNILSYRIEKIYFVNKMSEFEFKRLLDEMESGSESEYDENGDFLNLAREIQRNLRRKC